jgi:hypothetical protein
MMCVQTVTNQSGVLSKEDYAPNTEASSQSGKKCKLLCNPQRLPLPPYPQPKIPVMTKEQTRKVKDYFSQRYVRLENVARDKGWIR